MSFTSTQVILRCFLQADTACGVLCGDDIERQPVIAEFTSFQDTQEIPEYWKKIKKDGTLEKISNGYSKNVLGICIGTQNVFEYQYGIGI